MICSLSFLARAAFLAVRSFSLAADLSAWFVLVYYIVVEIVPSGMFLPIAFFSNFSGMVLLILHKLPPSKENSVNSPLFNSSDQDYRYEIMLLFLSLKSYGTAYSGDSQSGEESWVAERYFSLSLFLSPRLTSGGSMKIQILFLCGKAVLENSSKLVSKIS